MITDKNIAYILFIIIPLYWAGGFLYEQGTFVHQIIIGLWYLICLYYMVKFIHYNYRATTGFFLLVFLLMNIFYWAISSHQRYVFIQYENTIGMLKFILQPLLMYFPFYILARKNIVTEKKMILMFCITFIMCYFLYVTTAENIMEAQGSTATTNNIGYQFVTMFPITFIFFKRKIFVAL